MTQRIPTRIGGGLGAGRAWAAAATLALGIGLAGCAAPAGPSGPSGPTAAGADVLAPNPNLVVQGIVNALRNFLGDIFLRTITTVMTH